MLRALASCLLPWLCSCGGDPLAGPVDLFHNLEGGEIAQHRPPPPGAGQPYPKLGTVPAKPVVADQNYRRQLQAQLLNERDRTERVAADSPIQPVPPPPPAPASSAAQPATANATLDTADAPPPKPQTPPNPAAAAAALPVTPDPAPPPGTPLTIAGAAIDVSTGPSMPPAPPPPATFEGVSAEPAPTPRIIPAKLTPPPAGTPVFFAPGSTVLPQSQRQTLSDFASHRGKHAIDIIGLGEATSDTPDGQATAIALALARARTVGEALVTMRVPQSALLLEASAFGRGVVLRQLP